MNIIAALLTSLYLLFVTPESKNPAPTKVLVSTTNIRSSAGSLKFGVYKDQAAFEDEKPLMKKTVYKTDIKDGIVISELMLAPGTYGIALLDDENNNGKMDYGLFLPDEGFGFTNYYHTGLSKPKLNKFSFIVTEGKTSYVVIKVKYM